MGLELRTVLVLFMKVLFSNPSSVFVNNKLGKDRYRHNYQDEYVLQHQNLTKKAKYNIAVSNKILLGNRYRLQVSTIMHECIWLSLSSKYGIFVSS